MEEKGKSMKRKPELQVPLPPFIVAMKGHPGTGKSTLARSIASHFNCPLLDKDDIRDATFHLQSIVPPNLLNDLSYESLFNLVTTQIRVGLSVVVDTTLSRRTHLDRLVQIASEVGGRVILVECKPGDQEEWRRRLEQRGGEDGSSWHKPATWRDLEKLVDGYGGSTEYGVGDTVSKIVVDTTAAASVAVDDDGVGTCVIHFIDSCLATGSTLRGAA